MAYCIRTKPHAAECRARGISRTSFTVRRSASCRVWISAQKLISARQSTVIDHRAFWVDFPSARTGRVRRLAAFHPASNRCSSIPQDQEGFPALSGRRLDCRTCQSSDSLTGFLLATRPDLDCWRQADVDLRVEQRVLQDPSILGLDTSGSSKPAAWSGGFRHPGLFAQG